MKELKVDAIQNGTVIDHIPAGQAFKLISKLNLKDSDPIMVGTQLSSKKYGKKDIIKIENKYFSDNELNLITLLAPTATFVTIKNFEKTNKVSAKIPGQIEHLMYCPNPVCITNSEKISTKFIVESQKPITVRCGYCERVYTINDINDFIKPDRE